MLDLSIWKTDFSPIPRLFQLHTYDNFVHLWNLYPANYGPKLAINVDEIGLY